MVRAGSVESSADPVVGTNLLGSRPLLVFRDVCRWCVAASFPTLQAFKPTTWDLRLFEMEWLLGKTVSFSNGSSQQQ